MMLSGKIGEGEVFSVAALYFVAMSRRKGGGSRSSAVPAAKLHRSPVSIRAMQREESASFCGARAFLEGNELAYPFLHGISRFRLQNGGAAAAELPVISLCGAAVEVAPVKFPAVLPCGEAVAVADVAVYPCDRSRLKGVFFPSYSREAFPRNGREQEKTLVSLPFDGIAGKDAELSHLLRIEKRLPAERRGGHEQPAGIGCPVILQFFGVRHKDLRKK